MLLIPTLAYLTLRSPVFQTYLANQATSYLSKELGAEISVEGVNINGFLDVVLENVSVKDKQNNQLLSSKRIIIDLNRISTSRRYLQIDKIRFDKASVNLIKYADQEDFNFSFLIAYFNKSNSNDTIQLPRWDVIVRSFEFSESSLSHNNESADYQKKGFNYNQFTFNNISIDVRDIALENDTLWATLRSLSFEESGGFYLEEFASEIMLCPSGGSIDSIKLKSQHSLINLSLSLKYDGYKSFANLINDVNFDLSFNPSKVSLNEIGYFLPSAYGLAGYIDINGSLSGKISSLRGNDIYLKYGTFSQFRGDFHLIGLPDLQETFININVNRFTTHVSDLRRFQLPESLTGRYLELPKDLENIGVASFSGNFTGFLYDFVAFGQFNSALGGLSTNLAIISKDDYRNISYRGSINSKGFNLGAFLDDYENFGQVALSANIDGSGYKLEELEVRLTGEISLFEFKKYEYKQITIAGNFINKLFSGGIEIKDPNIGLEFGGIVDLRQEIPRLNFTAQIDEANLTQLKLYQRDSLFDSYFSTIIYVDGIGSNVGNIEGEINAYSTIYREKPVFGDTDTSYTKISTDVIAFENRLLDNEQSEMRFYSDFLDVTVLGEINLEEIGNSINGFLHTFAPTRFRLNTLHVNRNEEKAQKGEFQIHFKNTTPITSIFLPSLEIAKHSFLNGSFNSQTKEFNLQGSPEYLRISGNIFEQPELSVLSDSAHIEVVARGNRLLLTDSIWMEQFFISGVLFNDTITLLAQWENNHTDVRNLGSIKTRGYFLSESLTRFSILPSYAYVNDSLWTFNPNNEILIDSNYVSVKNFKVYKDEEYLQVNGKISANPNDIFDIDLNNFNLKSLAFLLGNRKVDFAGYASGDLQISSLRSTPNIVAELLIKDFSFNNDHLGDLSLKSSWEAPKKGFNINAEVIYHGNVGSNKPIVVKGYVYPEREDDNFDLAIDIENLKMSVFGRYFSSFASNFRGLASGSLRLEGPLQAPELSGNARLVRTGFRVDYLNTSYSFAHDLEIGKDYFRFENLILNDTIGNSAKVSGLIRHNNFYDFTVDVSLLPDNLIVLNTQSHQNELFYGKAFATGLIKVQGPVDDISIDIAATANRGTQFFLPLDYLGEVTESSFITFVSPEGTQRQEINYQSSTNFGLSMNFDISVTPESEIQIIFDSQIGDIMRGRGFGDLKVEIDKQGAFTMFGDYTIQEGEYLFTLQNLINKRFRIEQGGTIRWSGDPYDADLDVKALYRLRTSLFDLAANQSDTSDIYRRRVPVETVLHLTDKLMNPTINFDIQLPGTDESTREMIERIITTDQEMNRQVFSLLILNRFVPPEDGFNSALSYGMGSTSTELLSNQLSNWLSQISNDFDIGVNYRPGDEISSQELELALSTQLFDDRVIIDGNLGVAGNHPAQTQRTSNIIGDVNVEVKITPEGKFRIKAFNRSNTFDILNTNAPYTQGVGVFYRKEFDSLSELFRREKRTVLQIPELEDIESNNNP
jgi:hypothetical protein